MKKKALIVISNGFEDVEAIAPLDLLTRAGVEVTVASLTPGNIKAANGTVIVPTTTLDNATDSYDMVIFPGGMPNASNLATDSRVIKLAQSQFSSGKCIAAICASPAFVLGEAAGILKGKRATGDPAIRERLIASGADATDQMVTVDGNIITGMGPGASILFALQLVECLTGRESADQLAKRWRVQR